MASRKESVAAEIVEINAVPQRHINVEHMPDRVSSSVVSTYLNRLQALAAEAETLLASGDAKPPL